MDATNHKLTNQLVSSYICLTDEESAEQKEDWNNIWKG